MKAGGHAGAGVLVEILVRSSYNDRIEFLRSPLVFVAGVGLEAALEGRPIPPEDEPPKKSNPRSESCGFATGFGAGAGAGGPVLVGLELGTSAVLGLTGGAGAKSSKRFTFAGGSGRGGG